MLTRLPFLHVAGTAVLLAALALPASLRAQCLLVPVPLIQRVQQATLVVEARVAGQQAVRLPGTGHIVTRHTLEVFKVFKGRLPAAGVRVLTPGGTLGLAREVVGGGLSLAVGQQGIFLLEADPDSPADLRAYAGPQGFIGYDLQELTAAEPFGRYPAIGAGVYPALTRLTGQPYRTVGTNIGLADAQARAARPAALRVAATPAVSSFAPAAVAAGTSTATNGATTGILTINGSGFNATQGTGYVAFRNADNGGANTVQPLAGDYLAWSDTQIRVRVPSNSTSGNAAGTGPVQVVNSDGNSATTGSSLTVNYALSNIDDSGQNYRIALIGNGTNQDPSNPSGYVLHYATAVPTAARTAFGTALTTWRCQAGANRTIGPDASQTSATQDNVNLVSFGSLPAGVLGITYSYYAGCGTTGAYNWVLTETDYTFSNTANFYYGTATPGSGQSDFQSVALHEEGHGIQLGHIISSTGVMNYALTTGTTRRTLDPTTDLAGAQDETTFSTSAPTCGANAYASAAACPLPVALVAFEARYVASQGTALTWRTASEQQAAYFAVESQEAGATWQELSRQPAAGSSTAPHAYAARDTRPLAGTRYYRLRQVDADGTTAYSPVVSASATATALVAYPNPAAGLVHLSGPLAPGAPARVRLLDATGRCVASHAGPAGQAAFDLPLAGVPAGLYLVEWDGGAGRARTRLVVE